MARAVGSGEGRRPVVAVIGGSTATNEEAQWAEAVGRALAGRGALLVCGGRGGVMEAACRGAHQAGGLAVGILPGDSTAEANPYVDLAIVTGIGLARNAIVVRTAQVVIAIGGSYGTLSEMAYTFQFGVPLVALGSWHFGRDGHPPAPVHRAASAEEAVELAMSLIEHR